MLRFIPEQKIPAPVSRSAVTVPGSGIAVDLGTLEREYMLEILGDGTRIGDGDGASIIGAGAAGAGSAGAGAASRGVGDAVVSAEAVAGAAGTVSGGAAVGATGTTSGAAGSAGTVSAEAVAGATNAGFCVAGTLAAGDDSGCGAVGDCSALGLEELSVQEEEKFPGPHTSITAAAGGAAAR